jgi:hypothetical protein
VSTLIVINIGSWYDLMDAFLLVLLVAFINTDNFETRESK